MALSTQAIWKKRFLKGLIWSIAISALFGAAAIVMGDMGWFELQVLATSATLAAACGCLLACAGFWEQHPTSVLPRAGIVLAAVTALYYIAGIWGEIHDDEFWKLGFTAGCFAIAIAYHCLMAIKRLPLRYAWALPTAFTSMYILASTCSLAAWELLDALDEDVWIRLIGVEVIAAVAISITIPILRKLGTERPGQMHTGDRKEWIKDEITRLLARIEELEEELAELS